MQISTSRSKSDSSRQNGPAPLERRCVWNSSTITKEATYGIRSSIYTRRLIFYNMHPYTANDMNHWYDNRATLTNYDKLDGVIFHGTPTDIKPDDARFSKYRDKIFQVSSDAGPIPQRCRKVWNTSMTNHAFANGMMFQAETLSLPAADGIGGANPRPTDLS